MKFIAFLLYIIYNMRIKKGEQLDDLESLINEQELDKKSFSVYDKKENHTLIRPHVFRFYTFPGANSREKAYCVLKYFGWECKDVIKGLSLSVVELTEMTDLFGTTKKNENYQKFFVEMPGVKPRDKAIMILRGLKWKFKDISEATQITRAAISRRLNKFRLDA